MQFLAAAASESEAGNERGIFEKKKKSLWATHRVKSALNVPLWDDLDLPT